MVRRLTRAVLWLALVAGAFGCQTAPPPSAFDAQQAPEPPKLGPRAHFPPGEKVFLNHRGMIVRIQEPQFHMRLARRAFLHGRYTLAANEVARAGGGVRWFEDRAGGERRQRLTDARHALRMLERKLRRREVDSVRVLDGAFQDTLEIISGNPAPPEGLAETGEAGRP